MKKTVLSLALVLSISLAFGNKTKPLANENKTVSSIEKSKEISVKKPIVEPKKAISKPIVETYECYLLSCRLVCITAYGPPLTNEESMDNWEYFEGQYCD